VIECIEALLFNAELYQLRARCSKIVLGSSSGLITCRGRVDVHRFDGGQPPVESFNSRTKSVPRGRCRLHGVTVFTSAQFEFGCAFDNPSGVAPHPPELRPFDERRDCGPLG
jgi:hypothetical protein